RAQSPERTDVREDDEHLAAAKMASKPASALGPSASKQVLSLKARSHRSVLMYVRMTSTWQRQKWRVSQARHKICGLSADY
ncbi:hypothetical protein, partial [Pantoea ananatis]|uniref:hypothetical protein n=1 Tax=Pantoea ananas TaxID=553 RepID=UPI001B3107F4